MPHGETWDRGVRRRTQRPGCRITGGHCKVPTMLQVLSSIHYIYSQKTLCLNMEAPNLFRIPRAPSNLGTPLTGEIVLFSQGLRRRRSYPITQLLRTCNDYLLNQIGIFL